MSKAFVRRSRIEVLCEILSLCHFPQQKTHIMYKTNLSYEQLQRYIGFLVNENLLKHIENKNKKLYQVTEHGEKFLGQYKKLIQILNEGNTNILNEANTHISQIEA